MACEPNHKEGPNERCHRHQLPGHAPAAPDLAAAHTAGRREAKASRISVLLEALAYAGAAFDPAAALATRRYARLRDEEQRHGRW